MPTTVPSTCFTYSFAPVRKTIRGLPIVGTNESSPTGSRPQGAPRSAPGAGDAGRPLKASGEGRGRRGEKGAETPRRSFPLSRFSCVSRKKTEVREEFSDNSAKHQGSHNIIGAGRRWDGEPSRRGGPSARPHSLFESRAQSAAPAPVWALQRIREIESVLRGPLFSLRPLPCSAFGICRVCAYVPSGGAIAAWEEGPRRRSVKGTGYLWPRPGLSPPRQDRLVPITGALCPSQGCRVSDPRTSRRAIAAHGEDLSLGFPWPLGAQASLAKLLFPFGAQFPPVLSEYLV